MEWVKVQCNVLDHRKIKLIRKKPGGNTLLLLWFLLLTEAGKCGRGGALQIAEHIPYTADTLSLMLALPKRVVEQGLEIFAQLEMIEQDGVIRIRNWRKYQSEDKLELRREKDRLRQQRHREKDHTVSQTASCDHPAPLPPVSHVTLSRDVTQENRTEKNRVEKTTDRVSRLLLSQTPLANISDQELVGLSQRHGLERVQLAADVAAETWRRERNEIRNPGGYLNTLCEDLVLPGWYVPFAERQQRAEEVRRRQEMQLAVQSQQQADEEIEIKARDELWQSLTVAEREQFCAMAREECPAGIQATDAVTVILAKVKAWEARQVSGCS